MVDVDSIRLRSSTKTFSDTGWGAEDAGDLAGITRIRHTASNLGGITNRTGIHTAPISKTIPRNASETTSQRVLAFRVMRRAYSGSCDWLERSSTAVWALLGRPSNPGSSEPITAPGSVKRHHTSGGEDRTRRGFASLDPPHPPACIPVESSTQSAGPFLP